MTQIFLSGALLYAPLFERVTGQDLSQIPGEAAELVGFRLWLDDQTGRVGLSASDDADAVDGILAELDAEAAARLTAYMDVLGQTEDEILIEDQDHPARLYLTPAPQTAAPQAAVDMEHWRDAWGAVMVEAADEIMTTIGRDRQGLAGVPFGSILSRAQSRLNARAAAKGGLRQGCAREDVDLVEETILSNGFFRVRKLGLRHPTYAGGMTPVLPREVFDAVDAVTVLPYDPVRDRVLLIEQFRAANYARGDAWPWSVEAIAGRRDPGESDEEAARREALEEGGVTLTALHRIGAFYPSTGALTEYLVSYIGIADLPDEVSGLAGVAEEGEDIRVFTLPFDAAMAHLDVGEVENATLMISLLQLARMRPALRNA